MKRIIYLSTFFITLSFNACNREPFKPSYDTAIGYVIGKETCNIEPLKDYFLINIISSSSVRQQYGDTLILNGIQYTNVVKSTGLADTLKKVGQKIGMDFTVSNNSVLTGNCSITAPITYNLKEANIIRSGEAR